MKKLSEVCKMMGVTRRTLQEYNRTGLLKPTNKTESGYWLYDNDVLQKLTLIKAFIECGYERKRIESLLDSPTLGTYEEFDHLIETLEESAKGLQE